MDLNYLCPFCFENTSGAELCPFCGHSRHEPQHSLLQLPRGTILNNSFLIGRCLGQGGFGITYLAFDVNLQVKRAIKEFFPNGTVTRIGSQVTSTNAENAQIFSEGVQSFYNEARAIAMFGGHPNIVSISSFFQANGTAYFVMDYVEGTPFDSFLRSRGGKISWEEACRILLPIANALETLHAAHLMHRDIKPDNIFITKGGQPKLLDFGAARFETGRKTMSSAAILTPGYAPIEQYSTKAEQGPWTDVYALAATFYRAITGTVPQNAADRLIGDHLSTPASLGVALPQSASEALMRAMTVSKKDRTQSIAQFVRELKKTPPPARTRKPTGIRFILILAFVALAGALGFGLLSSNHSGDSLTDLQSSGNFLKSLLVSDQITLPTETQNPTPKAEIAVIASPTTSPEMNPMTPTPVEDLNNPPFASEDVRESGSQSSLEAFHSCAQITADDPNAIDMGDCLVLHDFLDELTDKKTLKWDKNLNPCAWRGIQCDDDSPRRVTGIYLFNHGISGSLPDSIGNLSNLTGLDLRFNQFSGPLPDSIGNLSNLTGLSLSSNQFSGTLPDSIGNLSNLESLYLSSNQFSGTLPDSIGNLSNLKWLNLRSNQFSGKLPDSIANLSNLTGLGLSSNQFSGPLPDSMTDLRNFYVFYHDDTLCSDNAMVREWYEKLHDSSGLNTCQN